MKLERAALLIALIALIIAGWCAYDIRKLQARWDGLPGVVNQPRLPNATLASQPTNLVQRLEKLEAAAPSPGLFMSAIQLHFAKLYYAAQARNWDLARFERGEILENLEVVAVLRPEEHGVSLPGMIGAFKNTQLEALKDAIEMKDRGMFREAYQDSIVMCNTCHQSTGRPFITITIPTNPPVANQRWEPTVFGGK